MCSDTDGEVLRPYICDCSLGLSMCGNVALYKNGVRVQSALLRMYMPDMIYLLAAVVCHARFMSADDLASQIIEEF